jgi:hypothetical protein
MAKNLWKLQPPMSASGEQQKKQLGLSANKMQVRKERRLIN